MGKICEQCGYELEHMFRRDAHGQINYRLKQWFCNYCSFKSEEKIAHKDI
jgi:hypothetical protein